MHCVTADTAVFLSAARIQSRSKHRRTVQSLIHFMLYINAASLSPPPVWNWKKSESMKDGQLTILYFIVYMFSKINIKNKKTLHSALKGETLVDEDADRGVQTKSCWNVRLRLHAVDMICHVWLSVMCFQSCGYCTQSHSSLGSWFQREERAKV